MSEAKDLLIPEVLQWNLSPARELASILSRAAGEIETEVEAVARAVGDSQPYFDNATGESARQRTQDDRKDALVTVDLYESMSGIITSTAAIFDGMILLIRAVIKEVEDSEWDLFYHDDGGVSSRKSNWEWMKKYWWAPGTAVARKELEEIRLTGGLRQALSRIQEADLTAEGNIQNLLEQVPNSAKQALVAMPTDPTLAKILADYQTEASESAPVVWPSGWLLDYIRTMDPSFQPSSLPREEANALEMLVSRHGAVGLWDFYQIKNEAEQAGLEQYKGLKNEDLQRNADADGHGDAFRHTYWNARMTQEFGDDWTKAYTTAHEKSGGNPPAREAMDLFNNEKGREIGRDNPDASPEELKAKIGASIQEGNMIVLHAPTEGANPQIAWSNSVQPGDTAIQPGVSVPLPGK
ncbi:hypothetical protein OHB12_01400 [Nocardia sp. NBC_01730]|uniref:DUF6973 domain-containing protein n=1 Tax=Nocardia sp. NBC_01730 TaxID=2975998 RepID=UPI002E0F3837|nr:hypothetical protein OHB12_01400 [Nocardia sp. NBC_01730]